MFGRAQGGDTTFLLAPFDTEKLPVNYAFLSFPDSIVKKDLKEGSKIQVADEGHYVVVTQTRFLFSRKELNPWGAIIFLAAPVGMFTVLCLATERLR